MVVEAVYYLIKTQIIQYKINYSIKFTSIPFGVNLSIDSLIIMGKILNMAHWNDSYMYISADSTSGMEQILMSQLGLWNSKRNNWTYAAAPDDYLDEKSLVFRNHPSMV